MSSGDEDYWASVVRNAIRFSVARLKNGPNCSRMRARRARSCGSSTAVARRTNTCACRCTRGESAAAGTRGPSASITSWISTSRRVPLKVMPTIGRILAVALGDRRVDEEPARHLGLGGEAHRVQIEPAVFLGGRGGAKRAAAQVLDLVAFHHRSVGVHEEAPMRELAAEQLIRDRAIGVAKHQSRQPAMAGLVREDAEGAALAEHFLRPARRGTSRCDPC